MLLLYFFVPCTSGIQYFNGLLDEQVGGSIYEPYLHPHPLLARDTIIIPSMPSQNPAATHVEQGTGDSETSNFKEKFILVDR